MCVGRKNQRTKPSYTISFSLHFPSAEMVWRWSLSPKGGAAMVNKLRSNRPIFLLPVRRTHTALLLLKKVQVTVVMILLADFRGDRACPKHLYRHVSGVFFVREREYQWRSKHYSADDGTCLGLGRRQQDHQLVPGRHIATLPTAPTTVTVSAAGCNTH